MFRDRLVRESWLLPVHCKPWLLNLFTRSLERPSLFVASWQTVFWERRVLGHYTTTAQIVLYSQDELEAVGSVRIKRKQHGVTAGQCGWRCLVPLRLKCLFALFWSKVHGGLSFGDLALLLSLSVNLFDSLCPREALVTFMGPTYQWKKWQWPCLYPLFSSVTMSLSIFIYVHLYMSSEEEGIWRSWAIEQHQKACANSSSTAFSWWDLTKDCPL